MKRITDLDLLGMMKRQHALSNAPSLLLRATSTITSNFFIIQNSIQLGRFGMLHCSLISILAPQPVHYMYGKVKNHKKTVKSEQARTRESEEYKAEAKPKPNP
ncbi:hypothetical protein Tco_0414753 [Tanacetum coccineum]